MDRQEIIEQLKSIISEYLDCQDMELVELVYRQEGQGLVLRLLVDYLEGGITIGECAKLNTSIGNMLDEKDIIQQNYILEVSSPGIDRPLKTKNDFLRSLDKDVRFFLSEPVNGKLEWCGKVVGADDGKVTVITGGTNLIVPFLKINKAMQEL